MHNQQMATTWVSILVPDDRVIDIYRLLAQGSAGLPASPVPAWAGLTRFLSNAAPGDRAFLRALATAGEDGVPMRSAMSIAGFDEPRAFGGWLGGFRRRIERALGAPLPVVAREVRGVKSYSLTDEVAGRIREHLGDTKGAGPTDDT
jgi:hypothetical protein